MVGLVKGFDSLKQRYKVELAQKGESENVKKSSAIGCRPQNLEAVAVAAGEDKDTKKKTENKKITHAHSDDTANTEKQGGDGDVGVEDVVGGSAGDGGAGDCGAGSSSAGGGAGGGDGGDAGDAGENTASQKCIFTGEEQHGQ